MPVTIVIGCFSGYFILKKYTWRKWLIKLGLILLVFFSNSFLANEAMLFWEIPPTPISNIQTTYDVGIVLTGITNDEKKPVDRTYFNKGADRIIHALQLYRQGVIRKILISGGSGSIFNQKLIEAEKLKQFLTLAKVPNKDIIIEGNSRNTYENAINTAKHLKQYPGNYLLITSSFHMRRAKGCFDKAGVKTDVFSTDFYSHERNFYFDTLLFPSVAAINKWTILIREFVGISIYKLLGYL